MKLFLAYLHLLFFLSLTATPPAIAKYAKTGCRDKCGNVRIPYPFGIGAKCSINHWYIVDCKNSRPYLPALNGLEVLGVDLGNQTVTVSTPRITNCQNQFMNSSEIMGFDLGGSPFLFSKTHNKFVFEGCVGTAALMADNGTVITGCSTGCLDVKVSDRNNCFGNGCCQTAIPYYLESYSIKFTGLERQGRDGHCASAFLVDEASYEQGKFSEQFFLDIVKVVVFNGTPIDTLKCPWSLEDTPYLVDGCIKNVLPKYAKKGCNDMCGNVIIPYPFGIGASCSLNQWYIVNCNSSRPYLPALNHLEVLSVNLDYRIVNVSIRYLPTLNHSDCQPPIRNNSEIMGVDISSSPFWYSKKHNKFVFEGCGTAALMGDNGSVLTGCSTTCRNVTLSERKKCFGIGCCQTAIPYILKSYTVKITGLENETGGCGSAFLVEDETLSEKRWFSNPFTTIRNASFIPISLLWTITDSDSVNCCFGEPREKIVLDMFNGTIVDTWDVTNQEKEHLI